MKCVLPTHSCTKKLFPEWETSLWEGCGMNTDTKRETGPVLSQQPISASYPPHSSWMYFMNVKVISIHEIRICLSLWGVPSHPWDQHVLLLNVNSMTMWGLNRILIWRKSCFENFCKSNTAPNVHVSLKTFLEENFPILPNLKNYTLDVNWAYSDMILVTCITCGACVKLSALG